MSRRIDWSVVRMDVIERLATWADAVEEADGVDTHSAQLLRDVSAMLGDPYDLGGALRELAEDDR